MKTRLKSCDRWHVDTPSRFGIHKGGFNHRGEPVTRTVCRECARMKVMEHRDRLALNRPYGVIRLSWTPPNVT